MTADNFQDHDSRISRPSVPRAHSKKVGRAPGMAPIAWAVADVSPKAAFWRPGAGRHNIAEIALHHAWCVRGAIAQLSGNELGAFPLAGADWFELSNGKTLSWPDTVRTLNEFQTRLSAIVAEIGAGTIRSPLPESERFDLVLGVTCHAIYHAGQIQLLKVLGGAHGT